MRKIKRVPKEYSKEFDPQVPVNIDVIGTKDDPCFGKLYEPKAEECAGCGDSELCAILCMHNNTKERKSLNSKFKDTEKSTKVKDSFMSSTQLAKLVEKKAKKKDLKVSATIRSLQKKYDPQKLLPRNRISELLRYAVKSSKKLKTVKKDGKRIIRYVH